MKDGEGKGAYACARSRSADPDPSPAIGSFSQTGQDLLAAKVVLGQSASSAAIREPGNRAGSRPDRVTVYHAMATRGLNELAEDGCLPVAGLCRHWGELSRQTLSEHVGERRVRDRIVQQARYTHRYDEKPHYGLSPGG